MKLKLHHVNLCSTDLGAMDKFYREVLDMETVTGAVRVAPEGSICRPAETPAFSRPCARSWGPTAGF